MKRRYKALIAIVVPVTIVTLLKYTHDTSYQWIMGYMVAVALVFKTSIVSMWLAAELHMVSFIAGLTAFQAIILLIKRWLLDSVLATWIQTHIIDNVIDALKEAKDFYLRQDLKTKFRNIFVFLFGLIFSGWVLYIVGFLDNLVLFAELRLFIAGVFSAIVTFLTKAASWALSVLAITWLGPIVEVFALSYLLIRLETWLGANNFLSKMFNFIGDKINIMLYYLGILKDKHIDPLILDPMISKSKQMGTQLSSNIRNKKIQEEYRSFESFENIIMKGHIDAYFSFKGTDNCPNKKALYTRINKKTSNNIDIVAYVARDFSGALLEEDSVSNFYHDIFFLESFASHKEYGVKVYDEDADELHISHHDFWVLNTSRHPVTITSQSQNFETIQIEGNGLQLIKTSKPFCYKDGDVCCGFKGVEIVTTALERDS
ncbi:hypothetical protein [Sulfurovum sp.]|uniref:hypothetical protein n=1 Tax=Sulfurovum sp. TaxID=1969726 RepID=UPI0028681E20|nr:hypothetical protein [Sulfurovum sp.]